LVFKLESGILTERAVAMSFSPKITDEMLKSAAASAATIHLSKGETTTDAVVKAAAALPAMTEEHVRRLCEMTYHEVFERSHRMADGDDRYVTFDPPNVKEAAAKLRAEKVAQFAKIASSNPPPSAGSEKVASEKTRPFVRTNFFDEVTKTARAQTTLQYHDPYAEVRIALADIQQKIAQVDTEANQKTVQSELDLLELLARIDQEVATGSAVEDVLGLIGAKFASARVESVGGHAVLIAVTGELAKRGQLPEKIASSPDRRWALDHPIALLSEKLASQMFDIAAAREALIDMRAVERSIKKEMFHA
jgi:hypothetical protein